MIDFTPAADKIAKEAEAAGARIDQIDIVLCENGNAVGYYAYAGDETFLASTSLPFVMKSEDAFLMREWGDALLALLPASVRAESVYVSGG